MTDPAVWLAVAVGLALGWLTRFLPRTWPRRPMVLNAMCSCCGMTYDVMSRPHGSQLGACSDACAAHLVGRDV